MANNPGNRPTLAANPCPLHMDRTTPARGDIAGISRQKSAVDLPMAGGYDNATKPEKPMIENEEEIPLREVKVKPYGTHGIMPANPEDCPYRGENSCISSSGISMCGALYEEDYDVEPGHITIRCMEDQTFSPEVQALMR